MSRCRRRHTRRPLARLLAAPIAATLALTGCSFNPSNHTLPGSGVRGDTYQLNLEFASLLSLPAGADVRSGGITVGNLDGITLTPEAATAHVNISDTAQVPAGTRAELRQSTLLGDIYIALIPDDSGQPLQDGDTIPLSDTDPGPQIEAMLDRIAMFVNGGSLMKLEESLDQINQVLPQDPVETRELASHISEDLSDAAGNLDQIDRIVAATDGLSARLVEVEDEMGFIFSDTARYRLERVPYFMDAVLNIVIDVNTLVSGLEWLIPRMPHINRNLEILAPLLREPSPTPYELEGNIGAMADLVNNKITPFLLGPGVDIRSVSIVGDPGEPAKDGLVLLRMVGAIP